MGKKVHYTLQHKGLYLDPYWIIRNNGNPFTISELASAHMYEDRDCVKNVRGKIGGEIVLISHDKKGKRRKTGSEFEIFAYKSHFYCFDHDENELYSANGDKIGHFEPSNYHDEYCHYINDMTGVRMHTEHENTLRATKIHIMLAALIANDQ